MHIGDCGGSLKSITPKLLFFLSSMLVLAACSSGVPVLELDQTDVDLGEVINGEVISLEILIRNPGRADLVIDGVSTSCGCTSAEVDPSVIAPGEQGTLHIRFDSGAHGPETNGLVMRQIFIASNDPSQVEAEVRLHATIMPPES